jgi:hypothetical protein
LKVHGFTEEAFKNGMKISEWASFGIFSGGFQKEITEIL